MWKYVLKNIARVSNYGNTYLKLRSPALKTRSFDDCDDAVFPRGVREKPSNAREHLPLGTCHSKCAHSTPMIQSIAKNNVWVGVEERSRLTG